MSAFLDKLKEKRSRWVTTNRENDFEEGITNLLTELYPDNAHFIYELLQNAEDACATVVKFELKDDELLFIHNGTRLFNNSDVEAITNIGKGTKRDDLNKIGKFGVGFKSVFSYTNSPFVYSGDYCFKIEDLVVPVSIDPISENEGNTVFSFPFNNPTKSRYTAYSEVFDGLININRTTLLFLKNIAKIEIQITDECYSITKTKDGKLTTIENSKLGKKTQFLVFNKVVPNYNKLYVSIAFKVKTFNNKDVEMLKLIPDNDAKVSIFFPAEKETSNLKFHIHAPFASTVARDSIKDREENEELIALLSQLLCDATFWMKENELLDNNFISCLPVETDNLSEFYLPLQESIVQLFNNEDLLLCEDGNFHSADKCWRSSRKLKDVIDTKLLKVLNNLTDDNEYYWLRGINSSENYYKRSSSFFELLEISDYSENMFKDDILKITKSYCLEESKITSVINNWLESRYYPNEQLNKVRVIVSQAESNTDLLLSIRDLEDDWYFNSLKESLTPYYNAIILGQFLKDRTDEWLQSLYALLYTILNSYSVYSDLLVLIRLNNDEFNWPKKKCYFSSSSEMSDLQSYVVKVSTYSSDKKSKITQKAKAFLSECLNISTISLSDEVDFLLERYRYGSAYSNAEHLRHVEMVYKCFIDESYLPDSIADKPFLLSNNNEYVAPSNVLIDSPYSKTNLKYFESVYYKLLSSEYSQIEGFEKESFNRFLKAIGCLYSLPIKSEKNSSKIKSQLGGGAKESDYCIADDYSFLINVLSSPTLERSLVVWNQMSKLRDDTFFKAKYRANKSSETKYCDSSLARSLKNNAWLPDVMEKFHKPADITKDNLHKDFAYNNANGWLNIIGFGCNSVQEQVRTNAKELFVKSGMPEELAEKALSGNIPWGKIQDILAQEKQASNDLKSSIKKHNRTTSKLDRSIDPSIVVDEEKFIEKLQQQLYRNDDASSVQTKSYKHSQKVKVGKKDTKEFLELQYFGHCQICGFTFSQSGVKGNYFEMFDWLSEQISKQQSNVINAGSSLSLCSRCHSILKHGTFEPTFIENLNEIESADYDQFAEKFDLVVNNDDVPEAFRFIEMDLYKLPVKMLNEDKYIFYSQEHFMHFHTLLTLEKGVKEDKLIPEIDNDSADVEQVIVEPLKVVKIGSIVSVKYYSNKSVVSVRIVGDSNIKLIDKRVKPILLKADLAQAIIDKPVGYIVEFECGKNKTLHKIKILEIE